METNDYRNPMTTPANDLGKVWGAGTETEAAAIATLSDYAIANNMRQHCKQFGGDMVGTTPDKWALRQVSTSDFHIALPAILGETGHLCYDGSFHNFDSYAIHERLTLLRESGVLYGSHPLTIVEIGPGWGGLAAALSDFLADRRVNFVLIDLPTSLQYARHYLRCRMADRGHPLHTFTFMETNDIMDMDADLVINTMSFSEMPVSVVRNYGHKSAQWLWRRRGWLFEQNHDGRWLGLIDPQEHLKPIFNCSKRIQSRAIPQPLMGTATLYSDWKLPAPWLPAHYSRYLLWTDSIWMKRKLTLWLQRRLSPRAFAKLHRLFGKPKGKR